MKRLSYLFVLLASLLFINNVSAASITKATYDGNIKLEGTGSGSVQIVLFGVDNKPVFMTTTNTTDGKFSIELPNIEGLADGNYKVKVADYNGTNTDDETVTVKHNNPDTGDKIDQSIILFGLSGLCVISGIVYIKKRSIKKG